MKRRPRLPPALLVPTLPPGHQAPQVAHSRGTPGTQRYDQGNLRGGRRQKCARRVEKLAWAGVKKAIILDPPLEGLAGQADGHVQ